MLGWCNGDVILEKQKLFYNTIMELDHSNKDSRIHLEDGHDNVSRRNSEIHLDLDKQNESTSQIEVPSGSGSSRPSESRGDESGISRSHQEVGDCSGSSRHSHDGSESSKHLTESNVHWEPLRGENGDNNKQPEPIYMHRSEENINLFELNPDIVNGYGNREIFDAFFNSDNLPEPSSSNEPDIVPENSKPSSLSSSRSSSSEDLFQVNIKKDPKSKSTEVTQPVISHDGKINALNKESLKSDENNNNTSNSPTSTFDFSRESSILPTESPPTQTIDRSGDPYEPKRIPSAAFNGRPSLTNLDWSFASSDSLFSIHINSFSRDFCKSGEFIVLSPHTPSLVEPDKISSVEGVPDRMGTDEKMSITEDQSEEKTTAAPKVSWNSSNVSDESGASRHSFAFPILAEGGRNDSLKADVEKEQVKSSKVTKKTRSLAYRCYSSCFSCW